MTATTESTVLPAVPVFREVRRHVPLVGTQVAAGVGNLAFAVCAARLLGAGEYADIATFLALYLVLHLPAAALSAAGSLAPARLRAARARVGYVGAAVGVLLGACSLALSHDLGLTPGLVLALALAAPGAGLLGVDRGLAYAAEDHRTLVRSLAVDPVIRICVGVPLLMMFGPTGGAIGTVLAGYAALAVCSTLRTSPDLAELDVFETYAMPRRSGAALVVAGAFVVIAVLQSVDLIIANVRLDAQGAATFAVLSTIGGAAIFATATIPLVLLPASRRGRANASGAAVGLTAIIGAIVAFAGTLLAGPVLPHLFGPERTPPIRLVGVYLFAMAALGVARVLTAQRCAIGDGRFAVIGVAAALVVEVLALVLLADSVGSFVATTLLVSLALTTVLVMRSAPRSVWTRIGDRVRSSPGTVTMVGLLVVGVAVRLDVRRGLWVDEAISVRQAKLPLSQMLTDLRLNDVHPPLHYALLWGTVRMFGASEFAVRLPSLIAGVALIPAIAWTGRVIYDRRTGMVAAIFATIAPFCVWYSQEARMYAQFMLFATLAVGAQVSAIRRGRRRDWALYGVMTSAMIWTQYFAILPVLVQQAAFGWAALRLRHDRPRLRALLIGWAASAGLVLLLTFPLLPFLQSQLLANSHRSTPVVPGQAGANSSSIGGAISIYAVGANFIWAVWGYHADAVMVQIAALWPLLMLLMLVLLGRGRSSSSLLLAALVVVPIVALFVLGSTKRDLFELRYFSGAVPALLLIGARLVTATTRRRIAVVIAAGALAATMTVGLVDQQVNGANPRLFDFRGAARVVNQDVVGDRGVATGRPVLLYAPSYLGDVLEYYLPDIELLPVGTALPQDAGTVYVLSTERLATTDEASAKTTQVLSELEQGRTLAAQFDRPNVHIWKLR